MDKKVIIFFIIFFYILSGVALSNGPCESKGDFIVLNEDEANKRLFVKADHNIVQKIDEIKVILRQIDSYIKACKPGWSHQWSVSFFTEKKYAFYKDEDAVRNYVMDGSWGRNYLAEYSNRKKQLIRYPLEPQKRLIDKIDLSR
jgi:hypothetical protein